MSRTPKRRFISPQLEYMTPLSVTSICGMSECRTVCFRFNPRPEIQHVRRLDQGRGSGLEAQRFGLAHFGHLASFLVRSILQRQEGLTCVDLLFFWGGGGKSLEMIF